MHCDIARNACDSRRLKHCRCQLRPNDEQVSTCNKSNASKLAYHFRYMNHTLASRWFYTRYSFTKKKNQEMEKETDIEVRQYMKQ